MMGTKYVPYFHLSWEGSKEPWNSFLFYLLIVLFPTCSIDLLLSLVNRSGQYLWEDHRPRSGIMKGTSGGEAISFSGCDDDQTSADTSVSFLNWTYM